VVKRNKKTGEVEAADYKQTKTWTPAQIRDNFAEAVYQDVVRAGKIFGLPLSLDTLVLFYNRTMFDSAQITKIPTTWLEIKEAVKKLTLLDENGDIVQAGIALGGYNNINRASDILTLLMMQNGTQMVDSAQNRVTFHEPSPYSTDKNYQPGLEALRFYTDFATPSKEVYSWNKDMPEASEALINGKLAMMLGYSYQIPLIRTQGAKLNLGIASAPHINSDGTDALSAKVNFASYWVETVAKKTKYADYAWDFLMYATSEDQAVKYLNRTKKPTALRTVVNKQLNDIDIAPFAGQVLTAKTWYKGINAQAMESIFGEMIKKVIDGKNTLSEVMNYGAQRINQIL
jgi:multiple sugar transport system substrate-binding protein